MFYSQTFLARKGPLGTVWCAAHLQHRLKKSHYTSTDIPYTVDLIMFPEVPIALRMSGHLLLGVVRIYSKKVDYLFQDCNVVLTGLRKAFASIEVNLPEDARQAPIESITLPETLNLETFDFDDDISDGGLNNHLKSREEITLTDQIPTEMDPYVAITFDEDIMMDVSHPVEVPNTGVRPMDVDNLSILPVNGDPNNQSEEPDLTQPVRDPGLNNQPEVPTAVVDAQDSGPSNQTEVLNLTMEFQDSGPSYTTEVLNAGPRLSNYSSPQDIPAIETMRDAVHDLRPGNLPPLFPDQANDTTKPIGSSDQVMIEKETILEDMLASGGQSLLFQQRSEPTVSAASQEAPEIFDTHVSFDHSSPAMAVRSTPPVQQPERRPRKRKLFDKSTVLTNRFIKKALEDCTDLLRKKRNIPYVLGEWKLNNSMRKEQVFHEPLITGFSSDLCNIFKKDYISTKPHLTLSEEAVPEPMVAESPSPATEAIPQPGVPQSPNLGEANPEARVAQSTASLPENDMEIERLRHDKGSAGNNSLPVFMPSPVRYMPSPVRSMLSPVRSMPSPFRTDFTPLSAGSVHQTGATGTGVFPTPDFTASTAPNESEFGTQRTEEPLGVENTGLTNIPELEEGLSFLETADNTPTGSQASEGVVSLSVRTRAVARYLKGCPSTTPISEGQSGDLSLNKILEGKTRKLCSRMFFETLVLKSSGLVDVQQEQPYGDITLKLTPMLSKAQI